MSYQQQYGDSGYDRGTPAPADDAPEMTGQGKRGELRRLGNLDAQEKAVSPDHQPGFEVQKTSAQAPADAQKGPGAKELTPIREAMLAQMAKMDGKGVGMKEFDAVCSKSQWEDLKKGGYTSCIDTQRVVAAMAFKAAGLQVKRAEGSNTDVHAFGTETREKASDKNIDAWVEAGPNMGQTPKPGDMLMLEKAKGGLHDKYSGWLNFANTQKRKAEKRFKEAQALQETTQSAANKMRCAVAKRNLEKALKKLEEAKRRLLPLIERQQARTADHMAKGGKLAFSHVGFFKSARPELGEDGKPTGRQIWETFDGGQSGVAGAVDGQGAMGLTRMYDPKTNFISGEASQGGAPRWLAGWVDIDKMVKAKAQPS